MTIRTIAAAAAAMTLALAAGAETRAVTLHRGGSIAQQGQRIIADVDLTGDGVPDIATCAAGAPLVLTKKGSQLVTAWHGPWVGCNALAVGDRNANGFADLVVAASSASGDSLIVFEPATSAKALGTIAINHSFVDLALGDVDGDNQVEIVGLTNQNTFVFNGSSLALEWQATGHGGSTLRLASIDDDARIEIVINGGTGRVLDAAAKTLEWGYAGGFGWQMELGNVDSDPESEIVWLQSEKVMMLNGDDFSVSSFPAESGSDLHIADVDGNGAREIIVARDTWIGVTAYDTAGATLWTHQRSNVASIGAGDVDGDGVVEICLSTSAFDYTLTVATPSASEAVIIDLDGPFSTAIADLDGDGSLEMIVGSTSTNNGYDSALVQVLDYRTRAVKGTLVPTSGNVGWWPVVWDIQVGQLDADPALEVLVLSGDPYDGVLNAYDGATYANQWTNNSDWGRLMTVTNMDNDAVDEIVIATSTNIVHVLHGASPVIQWSSPQQTWIQDLAVGDVDSNGSKEVLIGTSEAVAIFTPGTDGVRTLAVGAEQIVAMPGRFSILQRSGSYSGNIRTYKGSDLTQEFSCPYSSESYYGGLLAYGKISGQDRLLYESGGKISFYPLGGTTCPTPDIITFGSQGILSIRFVEVTGDDRPEMLLGHYGGYELVAIESTTAPRGDVNRDTIVSDADLEALARYLLADGTGIVPSADVNGDGCITTSDIFYLINYRRGTGPAPIP